MKIAVVGAGFSGSVVARELAAAGYSIDVFEARDHVAGNCHTVRDGCTGVMVHKYGPHIFHTNDQRVRDYVQKFGEWMPYNHKVKAAVGGNIYSMPVNLHTINQFFDTHFSPAEAQAYIEGIGWKKFEAPANFEEQALRLMGDCLYDAFFKGYTQKQWGRDPKLLPAAILSRLPFRFDYNDSYFAHPYQAIPKHGYSDIVGSMLRHDKINLCLNAPVTTAYFDRYRYDHIFYSGPLDAWFNHAFGRLAYRTLDFEVELGHDLGCPVMNYCDEDVPYTRRTDFRYFTPWEDNESSYIYREFSREAEPGDNLYYPVRLADDKTMLKQYEAQATGETRTTFLGRLGTYRYLDMDTTIAEALTIADNFLDRRRTGADND